MCLNTVESRRTNTPHQQSPPVSPASTDWERESDRELRAMPIPHSDAAHQKSEAFSRPIVAHQSNPTKIRTRASRVRLRSLRRTGYSDCGCGTTAATSSLSVAEESGDDACCMRNDPFKTREHDGRKMVQCSFSQHVAVPLYLQARRRLLLVPGIHGDAGDWAGLGMAVTWKRFLHHQCRNHPGAEGQRTDHPKAQKTPKRSASTPVSSAPTK